MDMEKEYNNETVDDGKGSVRIATEVITTIAGVAAKEVEGVIGIVSGTISGGIDKLLGKKNSYTKGVKVAVEGNSAVIDMEIIVEYGAHIPTVAAAVQEKVKEAIETMTGLNVEMINVHVGGVDFASPVKTEAKAEESEQ